MITFEQIKEANKGMTGIDFKGKSYVMVNSRVTAFRQLFPEGFITTNIVSLENGTVVMQAEVGYYENGNKVILGTGLAYEREQTSYINKTSFIENCETSAVGRALGFLALGNDDSICSAEELVNAIKSQEQIKAEEKALCQPPSDSKIDKVPEPTKPKTNPVGNYLMNEITDIQMKLRLKTYDEAKTKFNEAVTALVNGGVLAPVDWKRISMEDAHNIVSAVKANIITGDAA